MKVGNPPESMLEFSLYDSIGNIKRGKRNFHDYHDRLRYSLQPKSLLSNYQNALKSERDCNLHERLIGRNFELGA